MASYGSAFWPIGIKKGSIRAHGTFSKDVTFPKGLISVCDVIVNSPESTWLIEVKNLSTAGCTVSLRSISDAVTPAEDKFIRVTLIAK